jgi:hypothetical protein
VWLRRNLFGITRKGLPRPGEDSERATGTLGLYEGEKRRLRPLSPRQRRRFVSLYLLFALIYGVLAVMSGDDWLLDASLAGLFALVAVFHLWHGSSHPSDGPAS